MKNQFSLRNVCTVCGGLLLLCGALLPVAPRWYVYAPYVYTLGALLFAGVQLTERIESRSLTVRRLRGQQMLAAVLLLVAGAMMFMRVYDIPPCRGDEWKLVLAISAVLEIYTAFRLPQELDKES